MNKSSPRSSMDGNNLGNARKIRPANSRGAARLAAIQALYQMDVVGTGLVEVISEYEVFRFGKEIDGDLYISPDCAWFRKLLSGVVAQQKMLDPLIHDSLNENWPLSRLDPILRSCLRAGCFELKNELSIDAPVIISEYIDIVKAFYGKGSEEAKLTNSILDKLSKRIR